MTHPIPPEQLDEMERLCAAIPALIKAYREAVAEIARLTAALEQAGEDIHAEYCGTHHHKCCERVTEAIAGSGDTLGDAIKVAKREGVIEALYPLAVEYEGYAASGIFEAKEQHIYAEEASCIRARLAALRAEGK